MGIPLLVVPISTGALMFIVGIATFLLVCGDVGQSQEGTAPLLLAPPPGTNHYDMVNERMKRAPLVFGVPAAILQ